MSKYKKNNLSFFSEKKRKVNIFFSFFFLFYSENGYLAEIRPQKKSLLIKTMQICPPCGDASYLLFAVCTQHHINQKRSEYNQVRE